jgi:hypothetical protein
MAELERIVQSPAFRGTRRSREFLQYIVRNTLEGRGDCLKERSIGTDVFGRPPDYDTGDDSIVRVKASEVRKRLAQYYRETRDRGPAVIELPPGSYVPEFHRPPPDAAAPPPGSNRRWWAAGAVGLALALAAAGTLPTMLQRNELDEFWRPVWRSSKPLVLCVAHPQVCRDADHYVGFGDAMAMSSFSAFFAGRHKAVQTRIGTDTSYTDLRGSPAVLIGAFTNQWTVELTGGLRFVFERLDGVMYVRDRMNPAQRWTYERNGDYAIVSRVFQSKTGEIAIAAAGLSHYGTQVAGEFLTNAAYLREGLRGAPPDWKTRNLQLVLHADVVGRAPGAPKVIASWYW